MIEARQNIYVQYDPLTVTKSIRELGGPVKQVYYADSNMFVPNRQLTPLTLQPVINIYDPHGVITTGDKSGELASSAWYVDAISDSSRVTVPESQANSSTPYSLGSNGSLIVRKNITQQSPVTLYFEAEYYDTRRGSNVPVAMSVLLSTTANSENEFIPTLSLDKPTGWAFNPLKGITKQTINAQLYQSGSPVPDSEARYWWYVVQNGIERLIGTDQLDFFYVSGQNTKSLVVDPDYMKKVYIRCKAECYTGISPTTPGSSAVLAETKFYRKYPFSLTGKVNTIPGNIILPSVTSIKFRATLTTNQGDIDNPDKYFFIRWKKNTMVAGSTATEIGHSSEISLSREAAGINSGQVPEISFTAEPHGEYQALTDENGELLTDENGEILTGF